MKPKLTSVVAGSGLLIMVGLGAHELVHMGAVCAFDWRPVVLQVMSGPFLLWVSVVVPANELRRW